MVGILGKYIGVGGAKKAQSPTLYPPLGKPKLRFDPLYIAAINLYARGRDGAAEAFAVNGSAVK